MTSGDRAQEKVNRWPSHSPDAHRLASRKVSEPAKFHVPPEPWARAGWSAYTRGAMPYLGWTVSNEWYRTGKFLSRSVSEFVTRYPLPVQVRWWQEAGMRRVKTRLLSNGVAVVTWAVKATPVLVDETAHPADDG